MDIELVRILIAFFAGYFLSLSGSLTQLVTQNHLAAPSTLGFDGIVVFLILIAQLFLNQFQLGLGLEWSSFLLFCCAFIVLFLIGLIFGKRWQLEKSMRDMKNVILLGLGFNLFIGAIFAVVQFLFMAFNYEFPSGLWFGSFRYSGLEVLLLFMAAFVCCIFMMKALARDLRLIGVGRDFAIGLGVDVSKTQQYSLMLSLFLTGLVISFFGVFSFLGLIFPHVLRSFTWIRKNMRHELNLGPILSGVFLSAVDYVCYHFTIQGIELPVGMVSSVLGSLMLMVLLFRGRLFQ